MKKNKLRKLVAAIGIMVTLFTVAVPVQAATLTEEAGVSDNVSAEIIEEGTVAQKLEYTVVTDKAGLLTNSQTQNIEAKVGELSNYDVALYVENAESKICTQKYTNNLSEEMYQKTFGDYRNGIMIVFSFYKPENGYFAVHYGGNVNISESKVGSLIKGSYHDFKTDSTWIEGSFLQCIDYFKTVENEPVKVEEAKAPWPLSTKILSIILAVVIISGMAFINSYVNLKNEKSYIEKHYEEQKKLIKEKISEISELKSENSKLKEKLNKLEIWKKDAQKTRPTIQSEMADKLARETAKRFDKKFANVVNLRASIENFDLFDNMMLEYESFSDLAKGYVTLDTVKCSKKRQEAGKLYADAATKEIQGVCQKCSGTRHDRGLLDDTLGYYNNLPLFVRLMIAHTLIENLKDTQNRAEADYRRHQDSDSYSHNHNSYSGSTFGGGFSHGGTFGGSFGGRH